MKRLLTTLVLLTIMCGASAQRITRQYNNVSMAQALKELNSLQNRYTINFIYDELEDFRVTTSIKNQRVTDAIQQLIGFYPIRMTHRGNTIMVECTHKTKRHLTGKVVDETGQPVPYANVLLLSIVDSSAVAGGVSNESGVFVVPYEPAKVIARISYVGYKTVYRTFSTENAGTIQLAPDALQLKGVTVKTVRPQYKMTRGGMTIDIEHSLLAKMGTANDVLAQLPRVNVDANGGVTIFAKGSLEIYIDNRLIRDKQELTTLKSTEIKNIEILTNPGAQYNASVQSVIRIHTKGIKADGLSVMTAVNAKNNSKWGGFEEVNVKYRKGGLEVFTDVTSSTRYEGERNTVSSKLLLPDHTIYQEQLANTDFRASFFLPKAGFSYDITPKHSIGASYSLVKSVVGKGECVNNYQKVWKDNVLTGIIQQNLNIDIFNGPDHTANLYYIGKVGKMDIVFNGTGIWKKDGRRDNWTENSDDLPSRKVNTENERHIRMLASKLILSYPIGKGKAEIGTETTNTHSHSIYNNPEKYVDASDNTVVEKSIAPFIDYSLPLGNWTVEAGLRYEYTSALYRSFGIKEDEPSRTYHDWFPNLSVSWNKDKWSLQMNYAKHISRPSYRDLRSNVQYVNRFTYEAGNPYLRPTINHCIGFSIVHSWLSLDIDYSYNKDAIVYTSRLYDGKEIALIQNQNFHHTQSLSTSFVASPKFGWYQPTLEIDFLKPFFNTRKYGSTEDLQDPFVSIKMNTKLVLSTNSFITLDMKYNSEVCTDFVKTKASGTVDVGYTLSFLHKALLLNVYAIDLFKTKRDAWTQYGQNVINTKDCYNCIRRIGITLTYNFNAKRSKYKGTGAGNAEKSRL